MVFIYTERERREAVPTYHWLLGSRSIDTEGSMSCTCNGQVTRMKFENSLVTSGRAGPAAPRPQPAMYSGPRLEELHQ